MVIIGLFLTWLFGFLVLRIINKKVDALSTVFLSYLLGLGLQTLFMFYMAIIHIKLTLYSVSSVLVGIILILLVIQLLRGDKFWDFFISLANQLKNFVHIFKNETNSFERIMTLFIIAIFIYVVVVGVYWPVFGWDSVALYDFRAKVFTSTGYMDDAIRRGYFFGYPLMTSMAHTWVYLLGFGYPKFLYSFMYISLSMLFYLSIRPGLSRWAALLFTFIMIFSPQLFSHAAFDYTNLPYTVFFFISEVFLIKWFKEKNVPFVILSGLLMGIATWIRSTDPFWIVNIGAIIIAVIFMKRSLKNLVIYLAVFLPIQQSWNIFLSSMSPNVSSQALVVGSVGVLLKGIDFVRIVQVLDFVNRVIGPILALYVAITCVSFYFVKDHLKDNAFLYLLLLSNFGVLFLGSYIFSFIYPGWNAIGESLGRMVFVFIPLLTYTTAINFGTFSNWKTHEKQKNI